MIMNSTKSTLQHYHHHYHYIQLINEPTAITDIVPTQYDAIGAALFIIIVLLWYSMGIVCMLGMQIRAPAETIEDCARRRAKLFIETLRDQTQTKQILEELVDKQKRNKLWKIYFDKTDVNKEKLEDAETHRIRNIEKQLAVINRTRLIMNDTLVAPTINRFIRRRSADPRSTLIPNLSLTKEQACTRRRSSLDEQTIKRRKSVVDQNIAQEQLPWTMKKVLICRYFRRYFKNSSKTIPIPDSSANHGHVESIDNEQCHLLSTDVQIHNNLRPLARKSNERLNPYTTYFHLPINEDLKSNLQDIPLVTIKPDHHIIQMHDDEWQC